MIIVVAKTNGVSEVIECPANGSIAKHVAEFGFNLVIYVGF